MKRAMPEWAEDFVIPIAWMVIGALVCAVFMSSFGCIRIDTVEIFPVKDRPPAAASQPASQPSTMDLIQQLRKGSK